VKRVRVEVEFAIIPIWLLTADVSAQAVRIYGVLARLGYKGQVPHPSHKDLGETARCSTATVRRALAELADLGAIEVQERIDGRGRDSNGYVVKVNRPLLTGEQAGLFTDEQAPRSRVSEPKEPEKDLEERTTGEVANTHRRTDPIWDGFVAWLAREPETETERGAWNKAAKQLRDIGVDRADDVVRRGLLYGRRYPEAARTPNALVAHWSEFAVVPKMPSSRSRRMSEFTTDELEAMRG
jgi:hypothetical protein